jgi:DNA-binding protein YbaB
MKITELVTESRKIDEAPMGMLNKFGNKIASKFGSDKSTGKLKSGDVANKLYSAFNQYLGQSGQQPTWLVVSNWLQSNKYPIKMAKKVADGAKAAAKIPQGPSLGTRVKDAGRAALAKGQELGGKIKTAITPKGSADLSQGNVLEAVAQPLDKKTLEKVFLAAAQEAAQVVQQQKQNKMSDGGQQRSGMSVQQGGKSSQDTDPQITQAVSDLEQRVSSLEKQAGASKPARKRNTKLKVA